MISVGNVTSSNQDRILGPSPFGSRPTVGPRSIGPTWPFHVFPLNPIVNKSCNIECCGNKMHQIVANMNVDILICTTQTKSDVKDNYIRLASFILDMGH